MLLYVKKLVNRKLASAKYSESEEVTASGSGPSRKSIRTNRVKYWFKGRFGGIEPQPGLVFTQNSEIQRIRFPHDIDDNHLLP